MSTRALIVRMIYAVPARTIIFIVVKLQAFLAGWATDWTARYGRTYDCSTRIRFCVPKSSLLREDVLSYGGYTPLLCDHVLATPSSPDWPGMAAWAFSEG